MTITNVSAVSASRLRIELQALGMDSHGSRSELIMNLKQAGIYTVDTTIHPPKAIDISQRYENRTNIYIGNGAGVYNKENNKLYISNGHDLIKGDFSKKNVSINNVLHLVSEEFESDLIGNEGDIRREGCNIYMYRCTNVEPGWYPLSFGTMKLV